MIPSISLKHPLLFTNYDNMVATLSLSGDEMSTDCSNVVSAMKSLGIAGDLVVSLKKQLVAHAEAVNKTLGSHYRKVSVKIHPDRHGEHLRDKFDAFKVHMDVMRDTEKRHAYLLQMIKVQQTMPQ